MADPREARPVTPDEREPIEYLLNAMERAAQADEPFKAGYGPKRRAVLDAIVELRVSRASQSARIAVLEAALRGLSDMYASAWDTVGGNLVMMDTSIPRFEAAHEAARAALAGETP